MKIISWNVNGLRAVLKKGFDSFMTDTEPDIVCIQETKLQPDQMEYYPGGYEVFLNSAVRKGYSGTGILYKTGSGDRIIGISKGIDGNHLDEGRVTTVEFDEFYLVNAYVPNSQDGLARIDFRMKFEDDIREYLKTLDKKKPVIYCGDLNVAHREIDLKNPGPNRGNAGFSDEEREKMDELLSSGFTDTWRHFNPETTGKYTWWSYRFKARERNAGWRIDYFIISDRIVGNVKNISILDNIYGSDHCPVVLDIDI